MAKKGAEDGIVILLDTTVFIDIFRNFKPAVDYFSGIQDYGDVFFSAVSEAELIAGNYCNNPDHREKTLHFLGNFTKVHVENRVATLAGDLKREYGIDLPDALIAASAIITHSVLITNNIKDFEKIPELQLQKPY